jgi:hypothetical protein
VIARATKTPDIQEKTMESEVVTLRHYLPTSMLINFHIGYIYPSRFVNVAFAFVTKGGQKYFWSTAPSLWERFWA